MKKSFLSLLAVVAMVSCTQNDMDLKGSDEQVEIRLTPNVGSIVQSRTSYDVTAPTTESPLAATVLVSKVANLYPTNNLLNAAAYKVNFKNGDPTSFTTEADVAAPCYYPADGSDVFLWGLYPYGKHTTVTPLSGEWKIASGVTSSAEFTFTGKEDVMYAPEIKSDKAQVKAAYAATKLSFQHLLTKLIITAKGDDASRTAFGNITDITLVAVSSATAAANINNKLKIELAGDATLATAATVTYSGTEASFPFYAYDNITAPAAPTQTNAAFAKLKADSDPVWFAIPKTADYATGQKIAYSMVQPIANVAAGGPVSYLLNVKTELGGTLGFDVPVKLMASGSTTTTPVFFSGSTASNTFNINLTFSASEIKSIVAVGTWVAGGDTEYPIL